ncbi:MAG: hypothetical protein P4L72_01680 [Parvibaculum sp.]|uniref:hypothetical protein n=1 Tax=Parvibaculum sp. TaxID=2024848 RepID=UPI00284DBC1B|nr:hypothetical protein [Parvibaculum sp.]MDR3497917.1 hypothetical protein [Parvibaculum sp.]
MMAVKPASPTGGDDGDESSSSRPAPRIVIGLDTHFIAREALTLAARLAASVDARLRGIFVEDENLLSLSALPFAREISLSGDVRGLNPDRMLRAMQAQADSARRILLRAAADAHVDCSFAVLRGRPLAALAAAANAEDTVVLRSPHATAREVGRTARAATRDARADVLLVARGVGLGGAFPSAAGGSARPLTAIDDGSSGGEACAAFAETLARRSATPFRRILARGHDVADVAAAARRIGAGLLVVNADWLGGDDDAALLSAAAGCPVLLLGGERAPLSPKS